MDAWLFWLNFLVFLFVGMTQLRWMLITLKRMSGTKLVQWPRYVFNMYVWHYTLFLRVSLLNYPFFTLCFQVHVGGSVAVLGGKLYVSGGYDNTFELSDVVEAYDPTTRTWSVAGRLPQRTFWHGSVSIFRQFMPLVSSVFEPIEAPDSNAIQLHRHHRQQVVQNNLNNLNQNQDVNPAHWLQPISQVTF